MRRLLVLVAVAVLFAACGGATGGGPGQTSGPETAGPGLPTNGGGGGALGRPSGAKVRVVNAYNGGSGVPSIDVFAGTPGASGATPLLSVPYGTASDFFDPTVLDEQGDMLLTFYRHGQTDSAAELMNQTETLSGTEIITFVLTSGAEKADDGSPKLFLQAFFNDPGDVYFDATPQPGKGVVYVDMRGVDAVVGAPQGTDWFLSAGQGCKKAIGNDEFTLDAAGPGDGARYEFDPGDYTLSLHPSAPGVVPDCSAPALVSGVNVSVAADQTMLVVVYASSATDVRSMVLSLAK
jgi:hypothetical protein